MLLSLTLNVNRTLTIWERYIPDSTADVLLRNVSITISHNPVVKSIPPQPPSHYHQNRPWKWLWISPFLLLIPILTITLLLFFPNSNHTFSSTTRTKTTNSSSSSSSPLPPTPPRLFYFITGTKGDCPRLKRILLATYHPLNHYLLHLDLAASAEERLDLASFLESKGENVEVMEDADLVIPKGPTVVASLLHAVAKMMREGKSWDWFVNLGAEDYPLMNQDDILHIFSYLPKDLNFIEHTSDIGWKESQRVRPVIVDPGLYGSKRTDLFWVKERRAFPSSFKLFIGSAGMIMTRSFLEFCILGWDNLPRTLLLYYTNFLSAPESYFHSVICNSKNYQSTTVNHNLQFVVWDNPPKQQPANITEKDFDMMVESGAPFAHGFPDGSIVLDRIDEELLRRRHGGFTPGGWCIGRATTDEDPCVVHGNPVVLRPTANARKLESLLIQVLDPDAFRSRQCK